MDGLILVHKPKNLTSHDVVDKIRAILSLKKVGHFGTLDPFATGLLIIAVGQATRFFPFYLKTDKSYLAKIKLGEATDTYDLTGQTTFLSSQASLPPENDVLKAMKHFLGEQLQVPPLFSAKKFKGKPLYVHARKNVKVEPKACPVVVHEFDLKEYNPPNLDCFIRCSSGTYVRSLAHDLGQNLSCGAHLTALERTAIGPFQLKDSLTLETIGQLAAENNIKSFLRPLENALPEFPKIVLTETGAKLARNGNSILPENILNIYGLPVSQSEGSETVYRLFSPDGELLALAKRPVKKFGLHPFLVIESKPTEPTRRF